MKSLYSASLLKMGVRVRAALSAGSGCGLENGAAPGAFSKGVLLGVDSVLISAARRGRPSGVPLGGHQGCCSVRANGASARIFDGCAPPCARWPALHRRAAVCAS